jgi:hypothetical protein
MARAALILGLVTLFVALVIGVFVVHASVRTGCAEARQAASQAWLAVAAAKTDPLAAEAAVAAAVGELAHLADVAPLETLTAAPMARDMARDASRRAIAVCQ